MDRSHDFFFIFQIHFSSIGGHQSHLWPLKVYFFIIHIRFLIDGYVTRFFYFQSHLRPLKVYYFLIHVRFMMGHTTIYFSNFVFEHWRPPVTFVTTGSIFFHNSHTIFFSNSVFWLQRPLVTFKTPKCILFHNPHKISDRWRGQRKFKCICTEKKKKYITVNYSFIPGCNLKFYRFLKVFFGVFFRLLT
jgi:hypothetical protein